MSGEEAEASVTLPPDVVDWLDEQAEGGRDRGDVLQDLVRTFRSVSQNGTGPDEPMVPSTELASRIESLRHEHDERLTALEGQALDVAELDERLAEHRQEMTDLVEELREESVTPEELDERLAEQHDEFWELVEDVRERVIQVKREADAKAPADHDHPELERSLESADERLSTLESEVDALGSTVEDLESDLNQGFDNYEDILEYLTDATDDLEGNLDLLANAVVDVRETVREIAGLDAARAEADKIKRAANQLGIRTAECADCSATVDLALLDRANCPHCEASVTDVEAAKGFFGSNTLETGDAPALTGDVGGDDDDLVDLVATPEDEEEPPSSSLRQGGDET